jgi:hypothetical protein
VSRYRSKDPNRRARQAPVFSVAGLPPMGRGTKPFHIFARDGYTLLGEGSDRADLTRTALAMDCGAFVVPRQVPRISPITWRERTRPEETRELERAQRLTARRLQEAS